jgi:hypothetical protein
MSQDMPSPKPKRLRLDEPWAIIFAAVITCVGTIIAALIAVWLAPSISRTSNNIQPPTLTAINTTNPTETSTATEILTATNVATPTPTDTLTSIVLLTPTYTSTATNTAIRTRTPTRVKPTIKSTDTPPASLLPTSSPTKVSTAKTTLLSTTPTITSEVNADGFIPTIKTFNGHEFTLVPAGPFRDVHGSTNEGFWIGVYEVTNAQFAAFLNVRGSNLSVDLEPLFNDKGPSVRIYRRNGIWRVEDGFDNHPVVYVSWHGAQDYCDYIDARLPTGTEWHKAATWNPATGQASTYPWGNMPPRTEIANYNNSYNGTTPVGFFTNGRSVVGAYNMSGNVAEWVADTQGVNRLWRGGAWDSDATAIRSDEGGITTNAFASASIGFRCARDYLGQGE